LTQDPITVDQTKDNLTNHLFVREPDDETIFGSLVFVLGLDDEFTTLTVIRFAFPTTTELDLETTKVRLALGTADEYLFDDDDGDIFSMRALGYG
jgi:hypothetical protein